MDRVDIEAEQRVYDELEERRLLPGVDWRAILAEGVRALAGETLPLIDVHEVAYRIRRALDARRPLSLIRLGDGEALTLAQGLVLSPDEAARRLPLLAETKVVSPSFGARDALLRAIGEADLIGVPLARLENFQPLLAQALDEAGVRLPRDRLTNSVVNYQLRDHGYWTDLLAGRRVLVVGGPGTSFAAWLQRHGVDVVGAVGPVRGYPDLEPALRECAGFRFDVALVSAGVTACILCPRMSRELGVVAIDFGHAADETLAGEPLFKRVRRPEGPLALADLNDIVLRAHPGKLAYAFWQYRDLKRSESASAGRYTALYEDGGGIRRWSFIVKTHRPEALAAEARGMAWARESAAVSVPRLYAVTERYLAQQDLEGTPLTRRARPAWRRAVRALARFHAEMRADAGKARAGRRAGGAAGDGPAAPPVETLAARRGQAEDILSRAERVASRMRPQDRELWHEILREWRALDAFEPADGDLALTHGDLHAHNILVPDDPAALPALVDWETAAERMPVFDVSHLSDGLPAAARDELLAEYARARADAGWPCRPRDLVHDYNGVHRLRIVEMTAWTLADAAASDEPQRFDDALQRLRRELWKARDVPARELAW
ncbi:MAG: aminoglycoside phosphotransferase family protein [Clostridia bacterium]|nr:aminoglycoside phosphotransferase family protein [Clostridia bacterium]